MIAPEHTETQTAPHLRLVGDGAPDQRRDLPVHDLVSEQIVACNVVVDAFGSDTPRILEVIDVLEPSDFFDRMYRRIYGAAVETHRRGEPVTPNAVRTIIEARGGRELTPQELERFHEVLRTAAEERVLMPRALRIRNLARRRKAADDLAAAAVNFRNGDGADTTALLAKTVATLETIAADVVPAERQTRERAVAEAFAMAQPQPRAARIATGLRGVDEVLGGGVEVGSLTLLGAPYGTGKSLFAGCMAVRAAQRGEPTFIAIRDTFKPAHYFSRMACERAGIPAGLLRTEDGRGFSGDTLADYHEALQNLLALPLDIRGGNDVADCASARDIATCLRRAEPVIGKVRLLFVDYVQAMLVDENSRVMPHVQIMDHGKALAKLADTEGIAVVGLVQLHSGERAGVIKGCTALNDCARTVLHIRKPKEAKPHYVEEGIERQELWVEKATNGKKHVAAPLVLNTRILRYTDGGP